MRLVTYLLVCCAVSVGCTDGAARSASESADIGSLKTQVETLLTKVEQLERAARDAQTERLLDNFYDIAYLTPGSDGFSAVRTDIGTITATLTNVEPYANGSRITIRFGNPTSARIASLKATVEYGKDNTSQREKDVTFAAELHP